MRRHTSAFALTATLLLSLVSLTHAGGAQTPPPRVAAGAGEIAEPVLPTFDHSVFDTLLHANVKDGLVNYVAFRNNPEFTRYLSSLRSANLTGFEEAERIAFWLNVYNAYTIQLVASRGETESIRNINKFFGLLRLKGPWTESFVAAAGQMLTLDDVEHRILRHDFSEPRVHFAMALGARGGPPLRNEAYVGAALDSQLEEQTRAFLHDRMKNRVDTAAFTIYLSPVIARYRQDFGESNRALGAFLAEYYPPGPERRFLAPKRSPDSVSLIQPRDTAGGEKPDTLRLNERARRLDARAFRVVETPFDWSLNIQRPPQ